MYVMTAGCSVVMPIVYSSVTPSSVTNGVSSSVIISTIVTNICYNIQAGGCFNHFNIKNKDFFLKRIKYNGFDNVK